MSDSIKALPLEERLARLKELALSSGVQLVSEQELRIRQRRRFTRHSPHRRRDVEARPVRSSCPPEREQTWPGLDIAAQSTESGAGAGDDVEPRSQREFEESGAAATQNARLIAFWSDQKTHGKMFPLIYLMDICGTPNFHNRAGDARKHFEPLGFGIWNEMKVFEKTGALHSHYGIFPLAEVERRERERDNAREQKKAERAGQGKLLNG